jgi:hypothetical protein
MHRLEPLMVALLMLSNSPLSAEEPAAALRQAVTLYASFDQEVRADYGGGELSFRTRFNDETAPGRFLFEDGIDAGVFRIAEEGRHGGALRCGDVLPRNGRIFLPARGNIGFSPEGWGGAISQWINGDPNALKTRFCDPFQITHRGAGDGAIWVDFNDAQPRDLRMGVFPAVPVGGQSIAESDPQAPLVRLPAVEFRGGEWHHLAVVWRNFDTGLPDAEAVLYIDGRRIGEVRDRALAMAWDLDQTGIYVGVNFLGLLDEFAVFNRPISEEEIDLLQREPGVLAELKAANPP